MSSFPHFFVQSRSNVVRSYSYTPNTIMSRQTTTTTTSDQDWPNNNNNVPQLVTMDVEKEWSPGDEESSSTLDLLKPVEVLCGTVSAATFGEFVIDLKKVNGSLGFTLRQTDDTVLRHSVKVGETERLGDIWISEIIIVRFLGASQRAGVIRWKDKTRR